VEQRRLEHRLGRRLPSQRRLGSGGARAVLRAYPARIAVPGQRVQLLALRLAEQPFERPRRGGGELGCLSASLPWRIQ
jgi:hypothetical protein